MRATIVRGLCQGHARCAAPLDETGYIATDGFDVPMRRGDFVLISTELADLDPEAFEAPTRVDFERGDKRHMAFSYGPHRCLGSYLARRELAIALEEWLAATSAFAIEDAGSTTLRAAGVFGLDRLRLRITNAAVS